VAQYFVICTNSASDDPEEVATSEDRNKITALLEAKQWEVWHWFEDVWLAVNTSSQEETPASLTKEIRKAISRKRDLLVMQTGPLGLDGFGPRAGWKWTGKHWPG
jgi:hypothetical protein